MLPANQEVQSVLGHVPTGHFAWHMFLETWSLTLVLLEAWKLETVEPIGTSRPSRIEKWSVGD